MNALKQHTGLSADPVAAVTANPPFTGKVVSLPYMGAHKDDDTYATPYQTEEVKMKRYALKEIGEDAQRPPEFQDPLDILIKKIDRLAAILDCSAQHAEDVLFSRL